MTKGPRLEINKKVTMKDIAKASGMSIGTVDRALNNRGRISEKTRKKILDIAKELNYYPNAIAKRLSSRKRFKILVIVPLHPQWFWDDVNIGIKAAETELQDFGVDVLIFRNDYTDKYLEPEDVLRIIKDNKIDSVLAVAYGINAIDDIVENLNELNIPIAFFSEDVQSKKGIFFYGTDKLLSGKIAGDLMGMFLKNRNKSRICIIHFSQIMAITKRMQSFYAQIYKYYPQVEIIDTLFYNKKIYMKTENKEQFKKKILDDLSVYKCLDGIYIPDTIEMEGFKEAIEEYNNKKNMVIIAHENSTLSEAMLNEGYLDILICEEKFCQGYYPLKLMYEYLLYGILPKQREILSNTSIAVKSNIKHIESRDKNYLEAHGNLRSENWI